MKHSLEMLKGYSHLFKAGSAKLHVIRECDSRMLLFKGCYLKKKWPREAGQKGCAFQQMNNIGNIRKYQLRQLISTKH